MGKNNKPRPPLSLEPRDPLWKGPVLEPYGPLFLNDALPTKTAVAAAKMTIEELRGQLKESELQGEAGGRKSGETRLAAAEEAWRNHAFELALKIRAEEKSISQESLATEIVFRWRRAASRCWSLLSGNGNGQGSFHGAGSRQ
jgi:hypothetical protein